MVCIAFDHVHDIFNLVQKGGGYELGLISDQVICIHFYHVVSTGIALSAYFVHFIAYTANRSFVIRLQNARYFIPGRVSDDDMLFYVRVLIGLHVIYHAANVRIVLFLDGTYYFIGHVKSFAHADICYEFIYF